MGKHDGIHPNNKRRLSTFNYCSTGVYFITTCTRDRKPFFEIPALRAIVEEEWYCLPDRYAGVELDVIAIMLDHIHFIIWLDAEKGNSTSLSDIVGGYKGVVALKWLSLMRDTGIDGPGKIWQTSFYDHVIRNDADLEEKRTYILNNPIMKDLKDIQRIHDKGKNKESNH